MIKLLFHILLLFFIASAEGASEDLYHFRNPDHAKRFTELTSHIRCISCQHQTLADSDAPLAIDIKLKIASLLANNQTDATIKHYLTERYGTSILLTPPFNLSTFWLWIFPFLGIMLVISFMVVC